MAGLEGPKFYTRYYVPIEQEQCVSENDGYVGFCGDNKCYSQWYEIRKGEVLWV
jgi:hypothetical protein